MRTRLRKHSSRKLPAPWKNYARFLNVGSLVARSLDVVSPAVGISTGTGAVMATGLKQAQELASASAESLEWISPSLVASKDTGLEDC